MDNREARAGVTIMSGRNEHVPTVGDSSLVHLGPMGLGGIPGGLASRPSLGNILNRDEAASVFGLKRQESDTLEGVVGGKPRAAAEPVGTLSGSGIKLESRPGTGYQLPSLSSLLSSINTMNTPMSRALPYPGQQGYYNAGGAVGSVVMGSVGIPHKGIGMGPPAGAPTRAPVYSQPPAKDPSEFYTASGNPRKHVCKTCQKGFTTSGHLARHNRIHTGVKNHVCSFPGCEAKFSRHDNCMQHYKTHLKSKKGQRKVRL